MFYDTKIKVTVSQKFFRIVDMPKKELPEYYSKGFKVKHNVTTAPDVLM